MNEGRLNCLELLSAHGIAQVLRVAAVLGLADHMATSSKTVAQLAESTSTDASALYRLLCALANIGIVSEESRGVFALTPFGRDYFTSDSEESLDALARYLAHPTCWQTWGELLYTVKTGKPAFPRTYGMSAWDYRSKDPDLNRIYNAAIRSISRGQKDSLTLHYDFSSVRNVIDVGGGNGTVVADLLAKHSSMRGVLFDQSHVVSGAAKLLQAAGVVDRCEIVAGDFFAEIPHGGDLYFMRAVVHNWDDESATAILRCCRRAMGAEAKLLLMEGIFKSPTESRTAFWPHFLDLHMLVTLGGRQRTADEFAALYAAAGFRLTTIIDLPGHYNLIEGEPI
jgi:hypothetical protein